MNHSYLSYLRAVHDAHLIDAVDLSPWPFHVLTDTTMYVKREHFPLSIFAYETVGFAILNEEDRKQ